MKLPEHVAIIMDGNGRWARARGRDRIYGHIKGARRAKEIIRTSSRRQIKYLTLYAFSTENWSRPDQEVRFLMRLLSRYLKRESQRLLDENIQFRSIGELDRLPSDIQKQVRWLEENSRQNDGLVLTFALNYSGRQELTKAVKEIAADILNHRLEVRAISEKLISTYLDTAGIPDPDLIIRTSGEIRLSNFLLWQAAYSELYFTSTLWPDFGEPSFDEALSAFSQRERRFGGVLSPALPSIDEDVSLGESSHLG